MNFKNFRGLLILILLINFQWSFSQVTDISYTISPSAEHTWWDTKYGVEDGFLLGGKLGIGFGEYLELRGSYFETVDLKTQFNNFGLPNFTDSMFVARDVKMTRWGGELKANLSRGTMLPFLTLGTGIQSIKMDTFETNKQIYISAGAGIVFSVGDRYTLTLEGKNTPFNFNPGSNFLTEDEKAALDVTDDALPFEKLKDNWSVNASLQFYLGGRRPGKLSDLDKAYLNTFSGGLKGLRVQLEPTLANMNFDNSLPYRDTWMFGGYAGVDFNPYIGVRGFYLQAMDDNKIDTNFDDLAMYGGELRLKLSTGKGFTPYIILGGGQLEVKDKYIPRDTIAAKSQAFAQGGIGLTLPLSDRFQVFGSARATLTSGQKFEELKTQDDIQTSWMYGMGVRLILGKKSRPENVLKSEVDAALMAQQQVNEANATTLKNEYEAKLVALETQLNEAYAQQDIEKAAALLQQKETAEKVVAELENREAEQAQKKAEAAQKANVQQGINIIPSNSRIQMSPAEFQLLIEEILENMGESGQRISPIVEQQLSGNNNAQAALQQQEMDRRMREIEKLLVQMNERQTLGKELEKTQDDARDQVIRRDLTEFSAKLLLELQRLNDKVEQNNKEIQAVKMSPPTGSTSGGLAPEGQPDNNTPTTKETPAETSNLTSVTEGNVLGVKEGGDYLKRERRVSSKLSYEGMSGFAGFNVGGQSTANVGFRWHYGIGQTKFELMPETFFGFGTPSSFGLTMNGLLPITLSNTPVTPYLGTGAGFMQIAEDGDDKLRLNYNFIFGSYLKVWGGRLYVDFTARNLFKYNQVIAGYRFTF